MLIVRLVFASVKYGEKDRYVSLKLSIHCGVRNVVHFSVVVVYTFIDRFVSLMFSWSFARSSRFNVCLLS